MGTMVREIKMRYDGSKLAAIRRDKGLTVRGAAVEIGISYVTLSRIENGCETTEQMLQKICDTYKVLLKAILVS